MPNITGFAPDLDPTTPGILLDCAAMVPTLKGMRAAPSAVSAGLPLFPGTVIGAVAAQRLNNTRRTIYGTRSALYEFQEVVRVPASATAKIDGQVTSITLDKGGTGYTSAPAVTITGGGGSGATASADVILTLRDIKVDDPGVWYESNPTVTITGGGGSGATARAIIGARQAFVDTLPGKLGSGMTKKPTFVVSGGGGTGMTLDCVISATGSFVAGWVTKMGIGYTSAPAVQVVLDPVDVGRATPPEVKIGLGSIGVQKIELTSPGQGYTSAPAVTITGGKGSIFPTQFIAKASAILDGAVSKVTLTNGGSGYTSEPTVTLSGGGGTGATARAAWKSYVASLALTNKGSGYAAQPTVTITGGGGSGATASATVANGALTGITLTAPGAGYTSVPEVKISAPDMNGLTNIGRATPYTASTQATWRFAQFGDATIAANGADPLQQAIAGNFSDISGSPVAKIVESVAGFVFAFNTTDATDGARPDGWTCSGIYDQTVWTPSQATQCAKGRLIDTPGEIRAGRALGADMVVYKANSMYFGTYQGPPIIWAFPCVSTQIGAPCQEAVVSIGVAHIFMGNDNFYVFDGTRPMPIGDEIKTWWLNDLDPAYRHIVRSVHNHTDSLIYWYYVGRNSGGKINRCVVYNYKAKKWGRDDREIECAVDFIQGNITWNNLGNIAPTWADLPQVPYDSPFWTAVGVMPSVVDTSHTVQVLTGKPATSGITTGYFGDEEQYSTLQYVRPKFAKAPTAAAARSWHTEVLGEDPSYGVDSQMADGKIDVDVSARWHKLEMNFNGDTEILGYSPTLVPDGYA